MASMAAARRSHTGGSTAPPRKLSKAKSKRRIDAQIMRGEQEKIVQRLYQKQGIDRKQSMTGPELREFMEQYVRELEGSGDRVVTDEEVLYVLKVADTLGTGEIRVADIMKAVATWQTLLIDQELIDSRFELYDHDSTGTLSKSQVAELLMDLNGGVAVSEHEVDWVVKQADGKAEGKLDGRVDHAELRVVLAVWYSMNDAKLRDRRCQFCCGRGPVDGDTKGSAQPIFVGDWKSHKEVEVRTRRCDTGGLEVAVEVANDDGADDTAGP